MSNHKSYLHDCGIIALAALIASTISPLYVVGVQPDEFRHFDIGYFVDFSLWVALGIFVAGILIYAALALLRLSTLARILSYFFLFWVTLTGIVFPVVGTTGMVDASALPINFVNLIFALVFSIVLVRLALAKQFTALPFIFLSFVLVFAIAQSGKSLYHLDSASKAFIQRRAKASALSKKDNLIVLSFDGLPGNVVREVLGRDAKLKAAFKDFIFFDKAVAIAPATMASITAELFGNRNFREEGKTQKEVLAALDFSQLPFNGKATTAVSTFTYGVYNRFNLNELTKLDTGDIYGGRPEDRLVDSITFMEYSLARMGTRYSVKALKRIDPVQYFQSAFTDSVKNVLAVRLLNHQGFTWDANNIKQKRDLETFIKRLEVGSARQYIAYMHFLHTHFPVDLDRTCKYRSDDANWYLKNQSEEGIENQVTCALNEAALFLTRLKELGVYDNTFFVLKSDHGEPAYYFDEPPHNLLVNEHKTWGFNRYRPVLMIKDRSRVANELEVVSDLVTLGDLAKTICLHLESSVEQCEQYPGLNLLGKREPSKNPIFYINVVKDETSSFEFESQITVELERSRSKQNFIEILRAADVDLSEPGNAVTAEAIP